jgi:polyhydroxyalkanoate synthesis regulator phasin
VTNDDFAPTIPKNGKRLLERLDHMVHSGQITEEEATDLRAASNDEDYEAAVVRIRTRHAQVRLDAAVKAGQMTLAEANAHLEQLQKGEHPRRLRAHLRKITSKDQ